MMPDFHKFDESKGFLSCRKNPMLKQTRGKPGAVIRSSTNNVSLLKPGKQERETHEMRGMQGMQGMFSRI